MHTLTPRLAAHYGRFNVLQLLRVLRWQTNGRPGHLDDIDAPVRVRFSASLEAGFRGHEFSDLQVADTSGGDEHKISREVRLKTSNYCIAGTLGPLPEPFTEWLREQARQRQHAGAAFLDIFNQRLNTLRFDMKAEMLPELNSAAPEESMHAACLAALMGFGAPPLQAQAGLPPRAWLALAAVLANCRRSAATIARTFSVVFGARVLFEERIASWCAIEPADRIALGRANHTLGRRSVLGRQLMDVQGRVRLTIPGLSYAQAGALLPARHGELASHAAHGYRHLAGLLRLLLDRRFDCEVRLQLRDGAVPRASLQASPDQRHAWGMRLGQTAWLGRGGGAGCAAFLVPAFDPQEGA